MSKYINTEELNKAISKCKDEPFTKDTLYAITELLPSVELKHGEWIEEHEIQDYLVCPFCDVHFNMCRHLRGSNACSTGSSTAPRTAANTAMRRSGSV